MALEPIEKNFRNIGVIAKPRRPDIRDVVPPLMKWLERRGLVGRYDVETAEALGATDGLT